MYLKRSSCIMHSIKLTLAAILFIVDTILSAIVIALTQKALDRLDKENLNILKFLDFSGQNLNVLYALQITAAIRIVVNAITIVQSVKTDYKERGINNDKQLLISNHEDFSVVQIEIDDSNPESTNSLHQPDDDSNQEITNSLQQHVVTGVSQRNWDEVCVDDHESLSLDEALTNGSSQSNFESRQIEGLSLSNSLHVQEPRLEDTQQKMINVQQTVLNGVTDQSDIVSQLHWDASFGGEHESVSFDQLINHGYSESNFESTRIEDESLSNVLHVPQPGINLQKQTQQHIISLKQPLINGVTGQSDCVSQKYLDAGCSDDHDTLSFDASISNESIHSNLESTRIEALSLSNRFDQLTSSEIEDNNSTLGKRIIIKSTRYPSSQYLKF